MNDVKALSEELTKRIIEKYHTEYRCKKAIDVDASVLRNLRKRPAWNNFFSVANKCGFEVEVKFK
ncbi:hypothetical protein PYR66_10005 [Klebsiella aerogenes]|nr:hypothetical protein PYR66_10005 [Klebsiella aerogenes]